MKIQGKHYVTSDGKEVLLSEMSFPHLVNAFRKALVNHDAEIVRVLEGEIRNRSNNNDKQS